MLRYRCRSCTLLHDSSDCPASQLMPRCTCCADRRVCGRSRGGVAPKRGQGQGGGSAAGRAGRPAAAAGAPQRQPRREPPCQLVRAVMARMLVVDVSNVMSAPSQERIPLLILHFSPTNTRISITPQTHKDDEERWAVWGICALPFLTAVCNMEPRLCASV